MAAARSRLSFTEVVGSRLEDRKTRGERGVVRLVFKDGKMVEETPQQQAGAGQSAVKFFSQGELDSESLSRHRAQMRRLRFQDRPRQ